MRAGHGTVGLGQFRQQPFHFILLERHVDLDGGVAGDGGGDARRESSPDSAPVLRGKTGRAVRAACARRRERRLPAGAIFTATLRAPKGSTSNPFLASSSAMSAKTACCAGVSSITSGSSRRWLSTFCAARCFRIFSNSTRSWATCWSTIHRPSGFTARMKESRIWPSGLSEASAGARSLGASASSGMGGAQVSLPIESGTGSGARTRDKAALPSTEMPSPN